MDSHRERDSQFVVLCETGIDQTSNRVGAWISLGKPQWPLSPHANSTFWSVCTRPCGACGEHFARFDRKSLTRLAAPTEPYPSLPVILVLSLQRDLLWFAAGHVSSPRWTLPS